MRPKSRESRLNSQGWFVNSERTALTLIHQATDKAIDRTRSSNVCYRNDCDYGRCPESRIVQSTKLQGFADADQRYVFDSDVRPGQIILHRHLNDVAAVLIAERQ
jgi:hypothetical protein